MPFHSRNDALVRTRDGRNVVLQEPVEFVTAAGVRLRVPAGSTSDGISTPPEIWSHFSPFGEWWLAGMVHDAAYRDTLERLDGDQWVPAHLSKDDCDSLFLEAMTSLDVSEADRTVIYEGVHYGGWRAFRDDRPEELARSAGTN